MEKESLTLFSKSYSLRKLPYPHIVVSSKKEIHGWWGGRRECTGERFLLNPYSGCSVGCFYCYARSFPGWFQLFRKRGIVVVAEEFHKAVARQLDSIDIAACGYLSPVTDPFQPLNREFRLAEKIIVEFSKRNIPIEFITKCRVPDEVLNILKGNEHNFGQISILTPDEKISRILAPRGAGVDILFENIARISAKGIFSVIRIDPILPFITDSREDLANLIRKAKKSGAKHVISSVLDIPQVIREEILEFIKRNFGFDIYIKYKGLYTEKISGYLNADLNYRIKIFDFLKREVLKNGMSFALCMEHRILKDGNLKGLNKEYMSSDNCEGINIPLYRRRGDKFYPAADCPGNCLNCEDPICGVDDLAMGEPGSKKDWKLKDYKRWSAMIKLKSYEDK
ncbi:MAG: radical SAM protein [Candidatus Kaelpia imicola]|nr:radical SAM protein [Candidatus Kaelpia imicola]